MGERRDGLLSLPNRRQFEQDLVHALEQAARERVPLTVFMLDLDHFKSVNDAFGHRRGDEVLDQFASLLQRSLRQNDRAYRYGGDEFVVISQPCGVDEAQRMAARLVRTVADYTFSGDPPLRLTVSIGAAVFPRDGRTVEDLIAVADRRHYAAKRLGRSRAVVTTPDTLLGEAAPSRLVGRATAVTQFLSFVQRLEQVQRGVVLVLGERGSGRTRFLQEIERLAGLRGLGAVWVRGDPPLCWRQWGAVHRLRRAWPGAPHPMHGPLALARYLLTRQAARGRWGLLLLVDDWEWLDQDTRRFLWDMLTAEEEQPLGLVVAARYRPRDFPLPTLMQSIPLTPLTPEEVRVWVRHTHQWDAPEEFIAELHRASEGLPGRVQTLLRRLHQRGLLRYNPRKGWHYITAGPMRHLLGETSPRPGVTIPDTHLLFGREEELEHLSTWLPTHRLVTLVGPGGIGKTRLAAQAVAELEQMFPDGVYWVPLRGKRFSGDGSVLRMVAETLGVTLRSEDVQGALAAHWGEREILLVLDNLEHLPTAAGEVQTLLQVLPRARCLGTSRRPLQLPEERVLRLRGLPAPTEDMPPQVAERAPAVQLFLYYAQQNNPRFYLTPENREAVFAICRLLHGVPLALRMVAAWTATMRPAQILNLLREGRTPDTGDLPPRQRARSPDGNPFARLVEAFWMQLSPEERRGVLALTVFVERFDGTAARAVANVSPFFLDALTLRGFLERDTRQRYSMHPLVRRFLNERIREEPRYYRESQHRFVSWFMTWIGEQERRFFSAAKATALEHSAQHWANIHAAWFLGVRHAWWDLLTRGAVGMFEYLAHRGLFYDGLQLIEETLEQVNQKQHPLPQYLHAVLHLYRGIFAVHLGRANLAEQALRRAHALLRGIPALALWQRLYKHLADVHLAYGRSDEAVRLLRHFLHVLHKHPRPERYLVELTVSHLARMYYGREDYERAERYWRLALVLMDRWQLDDPGRRAAVMNNLAYVCMLQGRLQEARELIRRSLPIAESLGTQMMYCAVLDTAGQVALAANEPLEALVHFREGLELARKLRSERLILIHIEGMAKAWAALGAGEAAAVMLRAAVEAADDWPDQRQSLVALLQRLPKPGPGAPHFTLPLQHLAAQVLQWSGQLLAQGGGTHHNGSE